MTCPACRAELRPGLRACSTCGSLIAFAPDRPQARLGAPLPPWEEARMSARQTSITQQLRASAAPVAARVGVPAGVGPSAGPAVASTTAPTLVPSAAAPAGSAGAPTTRREARAAEAAQLQAAQPQTGPQQTVQPRAVVASPYPAAGASLGPALAELLAALTPLRRLGPALLGIRGPAAALLAAGCAPLLLAVVASSDRTWLAAGGFAACVATLWAFALRVLIRPEPADGWLVPQLVGCVVIGGTLLSAVMELALHPDPHDLAWSLLGVALPEQLVTLAPVLVLGTLAAKPWTTRTFLFGGAVCGLVLAAVQALTYPSLHLAGGGAELTGDAAWRLLTGPLVHAACAGVGAGFLAMAAARPAQRWSLAGTGLAVTVLLLGLGEWASGGLAAVTGCLAVLALVAFTGAGDQITLDLASEDVEQLAPGELPPAAG